VAKYADACNLFGDLATLRHKLEVLNAHCEATGRDPAEITKTRLGGLLIAETSAEAENKVTRLAEARGVDPAMLRGYMIVGDPDTVCEQVAEYLDAGIDGLIFNMIDPQEIDPVRLAGTTLSSAFG
jgi:alkanesulfonate monooxygenase SsuD/methylene tetrahydromethanopterin reductase-like flavin-dependent oxidoreductase (luciferase family)